jgi:hypothetical protein
MPPVRALTSRCSFLQVLALKEKAAASTFATSASTPSRSRLDGPGLVQEGYIGSHRVEDFGGAGAVGTRALDVALAAEFV